MYTRACAITTFLALTLLLACAEETSSPEQERVPSGSISVVEPADGAVVSTAEITIRGTAPPNASVGRDESFASDHKWTADATGNWQYATELDEGDNEFTFYLDADQDVKTSLTITLDPNAGAGADPTTSTPPTEITAPTEAPVPTEEPEPVELSGSGQYATEPITLPVGVYAATFSHDGQSNFVVLSYIDNEEDLLINEIGPYSGSRPLVSAGSPITLNIDADGAWTLRIEPIGPTSSPAFAGDGDAVSGIFEAPGLGPWNISHSGFSNFVVLLHCEGGSSLIQNEIGAVEGSQVVNFASGPCFWEVEADGNWSLEPR
jgi:hypothetical protein